MPHRSEDSLPFEGAERLILENFKSHGRTLNEGESPLLREGERRITVKDLLGLPPLSLELILLSGCVADLATISGSQVDMAVYKRLVLSRVQVYIEQSLRNKMIHNVLQLTIFIGAASVTVAVALPGVPKIIPIFLSAVVAIATAIANYYKFGERSRDLFLTAEGLGQEYNWFDTERGVYKGLALEEADSLFMDRIEGLIKAQTQRSFALVAEKPKAEQK